MAAVLIVEDEEKIARFIELELKHEGYEVGKAVDIFQLFVETYFLLHLLFR